jgi:hypothetical protein
VDAERPSYRGWWTVGAFLLLAPLAIYVGWFFATRDDRPTAGTGRTIVEPAKAPPKEEEEEFRPELLEGGQSHQRIQDAILRDAARKNKKKP